MSAVSVLKSIDARLSRIERRSLRNVQIASVLDSVRQIGSLASELIGKARCLSSSGRCSASDGFQLCVTDCGRLILVESGEEVIVYKVGSGSTSVRASPGELVVSAKDLSVTIRPSEILVRIPGTSGAHVEAVALDDEEELLKKGYTVKLATRKLSTLLARSVKTVYQCIQAQRLQC